MSISVLEFLTHRQRLTADEDCFFILNGRLVYNTDECLEEEGCVEVHYRGRGGKGGFGSMLRAIGNQIEKTTNREMCRDLSGRRMRDVNAEERLKAWYSKASEREREKVEKYLEKQRKRKETLSKGPLHDHKFEDPEFQRKKEEISAELRDAVESAIENIVADSKKDDQGPSMASKRSRFWIEGLDDDDSSDASSSSNSDEETGDKIAEILGLTTDSLTFSHGPEGEDGQGPSTSSKATEVKVDETKATEETTAVVAANKDAELVPKAVVPGLSTEELESVDSSTELEKKGLECLKQSLIDRGLKCGGTIEERANRLFSVRNMTPDAYPSKLKAVPAKQSKT